MPAYRALLQGAIHLEAASEEEALRELKKKWDSDTDALIEKRLTVDQGIHYFVVRVVPESLETVEPNEVINAERQARKQQVRQDTLRNKIIVAIATTVQAVMSSVLLCLMPKRSFLYIIEILVSGLWIASVLFWGLALRFMIRNRRPNA